MKKSLRKINSSGFSHIELLLIIIVIIVLAAVGGYVWKHNNSSVNAGSWTSLGSNSYKGTKFNFYACVSKSSTSQWIVEGLATTNSANPESNGFNFYLLDTGSGNESIGGSSVASWNTTQEPASVATQMVVNPSVSNYITEKIVVGAENVAIKSTANPMHASSLNNC
jgi:hypothetical protein